jgi:glycosyltransferase involved in cell wall biosynthesis
MRIGIVTRRVGRNDGQGRVNLEIAREALRVGHQVRLYCEAADKEIVEAGAEVTRLPAPGFLPGRLLRDQVFAARSADAARQCDAVLGNGFCSWGRAQVNAVHFVHGAWLRHAQHPWRQERSARYLYARLYAAANARLERGAFRRAGVLVAVSQKLRGDLIEAGVAPARIATILNGVDTEEYAPGPGDRSRFGLPADVPLALFAGDLKTRRKNLDGVLKAMVQAPHLHLAVAGRQEGSEFPALAASLGVAERVHFLGFQTAMPALMRAVDFFVFPSRYEACSLVLLEAMASELPVITAASAGGAEIVDAASGFVLSDAENTAGLAQTLQVLAADPARRAAMGQAARAVALRHGWRDMARQYLDLLRDARPGMRHG